MLQREIGYTMQHDEGTITYHIFDSPEVYMTDKKKAPAKRGKDVAKSAAKKLPPEVKGERTLGKAANTNARAPEHVMGVAANVPESAKPGTTTQTPAQPGQHPMAPTFSDGSVPSITVPGAQPGSSVTTDGETTTITPDGGIRQSRY